jgi:DNA-binding XRE family transcriptional regulator
VGYRQNVSGRFLTAALPTAYRDRATVRGMDEHAALKQFATNLRSHRHRAGLSQERLAFRARIHRTEVSLLERGAREPRLTTLLKLGRALGCPPTVLLDGIE